MLLLGGVLVLAPSTLFVNSRACFSLKHGKSKSYVTSSGLHYVWYLVSHA